jgi:hypothetical protein
MEVENEAASWLDARNRVAQSKIREPRFGGSVTRPPFPSVCAMRMFLVETKQASRNYDAKLTISLFALKSNIKH